MHGDAWPGNVLATRVGCAQPAIDDAGFRDAVDAAVVLLFLLLGLRGIQASEPDAREIIERRAATARRLVE